MNKIDVKRNQNGTRYVSPTPGEMPIVASSLIPSFAYTTNPGASDVDVYKKSIDLAIECNFNMGGISNSVDAMVAFFTKLYGNQCEPKDGQRFGFIVGGSGIFEVDHKFEDEIEDKKDNTIYTVKERFSKFKNKLKCHIRTADNLNLIRGWSIVDEPRNNNVLNIKSYIDGLLAMTPLILPYVNLVGGDNLAEDFFKYNEPGGVQLKPGTSKYNSTYQSYIDFINENVAPTVWSYDLYPIKVNTTAERPELTAEYKAFYYDLEVMRQISHRSDEPFWAYCQTMAHANSEYTSIRPAATIGTLRFEAFSALAYEAKGIVYWTFMLRNASRYTSALVAPMLVKKTPTEEYDLFKFPAYYAAKQVNSEIRKHQEIFLKTDAQDVKHTGTATAIAPIFTEVTPKKGTAAGNGIVCQRLEGGIGPFTKIESCEMGVMVSVLVPKAEAERDKEQYVMIVNHDPFSSQIVTMFSQDGKSLTELTSCQDDRDKNDEKKIYDPAATSIKRTYKGPVPTGEIADSRVLLPGAYMIFQYNPSEYIDGVDK